MCFTKYLVGVTDWWPIATQLKLNNLTNNIISSTSTIVCGLCQYWTDALCIAWHLSSIATAIKYIYDIRLLYYQNFIINIVKHFEVRWLYKINIILYSWSHFIVIYFSKCVLRLSTNQITGFINCKAEAIPLLCLLVSDSYV